MGEAQEVLDSLRGPARSLRDAAPEAWAGFAALHHAALADGVLPGHVKELMALVIAVSKECDGCIASHARAAARKGATAEQVAEAISVAILMNGGPATVYGPRAWAAFNEFAAPAVAPPAAPTAAPAAAPAGGGAGS
jgi:AhpD family alkylhydroperoxidase